MDIYAAFLDAVRSHRLIGPGDRVLAAVSGGPDSVALLHLLLRLARDRPFPLAVAHFDHRLRGEAAEEDARFVARLAAAHGLPCFTGRMAEAAGAPARPRASDPQPGAQPGPRRSEAALRSARYGFLHERAASWAATRLALGHTRDDQAETFLLRLLRGAGARGLGAMQPLVETAPAQRTPGRSAPGLIRPLLAVPRAALVAWLRSEGAEWREDESNLDPSYLRNRVRLQLLPLMEEIRPGAGATLARAARLVAEDDAWLTARAVEAAGRILRRDPGGSVVIERAALAALPRPLARRVLRAAAREAGWPAPGSPAASRIEAALDHAAAGRDSRIELGRGLVARLAGGSLRLEQTGRAPR